MASLRTPEERREIVEKCIDLEAAGESVIDYLKGQCFLTPRATWINIQMRYLGRKGDNITDGSATGVKRKGKRPKIREDALKQDARDWERSKEPEVVFDGTVMFGGKEYEKAPVTTCCARSTREGVEVPEVLPEDMQTEEPEAKPLRICAAVADPEKPELIALKVKSRSGFWEVISEENMIQFWADREGGYSAIRMSAEEWRRVIGEFPEVCRMMGVMQTEGAG